MPEIFVRLEKNIKKLKEEKDRWRAEFEILRREMFARLEKSEKKLAELDDANWEKGKALGDTNSQIRGANSEMQRGFRGFEKDITSIEKKLISIEGDISKIEDASSSTIASRLKEAEARIGKDVEDGVKKAIADERQDLRERIKSLEVRTREAQGAMSDKVERDIAKATAALKKEVSAAVEEESDESYKDLEQKMVKEIASMKDTVTSNRKSADSRMSDAESGIGKAMKDIEDLKRLKDAIQSLKTENDRKFNDSTARMTELSRRLEAIERIYADEIKKLSEEAENI